MRVEEFANRALMRLHAKPRCNRTLQVHARPAHHLVPRPLRPAFDQPFEFGFLLARQLWRTPGVSVVGKARDAAAVVAMHPAAQRLAIHAAAFGGDRTIRAFKHQGQSQDAPHDSARLASSRSPAALKSIRVIATPAIACLPT